MWAMAYRTSQEKVEVMITSTMTIEDRCFEACRMYPVLYEFHKEKSKIFHDRLMKKTSAAFPYYNRFTFVDDKRNEWHFVYLCKSKEWRRKSIYFCFAYFIYEIPPMRKENQTNAGKGVISCNPDYLGRYYSNDYMMADEDCIIPFIFDIVPHAMNRYNERYLKPKGLDDLDFTKKVEMMLGNWINFDVSADLYGDISTKNNLKENSFPYDITLRNCGTLKGTLYTSCQYIQFYTFISNDIMYQDQIERHKTMTKEYYQLYNPLNM